MRGASSTRSVRSRRSGDARRVSFRLRQPECLSQSRRHSGDRAAHRREVRLCADPARRRVQADQQPLARGKLRRRSQQASLRAARNGALHQAARHRELSVQSVLPGEHARADARGGGRATARRLRALRRRDVPAHVGAAERHGRSCSHWRGASGIRFRCRKTHGACAGSERQGRTGRQHCSFRRTRHVRCADILRRGPDLFRQEHVARRRGSDRRREVMMRTAVRCSLIVLFMFAAQLASAADADDSDYFGLLRARDITPFGFLRLDMRPTHALNIPSGGWGMEMELAYQNTWALSPEVENYLDSLEGPRREIGPAELDAIRALPGENYLADLELALLDVSFQYKFSSQWGAYLVLSGVHYGGGFLDSTIEKFHETFGFSDFGRPAVVQNGTSYILDLKNSQVALIEAPTSGGYLDTTIGLRYSGLTLGKDWKVIVEAAAKVPVSGRRDLLSTGRTDYGLQVTAQNFGDHHAWYVAGSAVYYAGSPNFAPNDAKVIPTMLVGY